jgi:anti-sigma factor RsiW
MSGFGIGNSGLGPSGGHLGDALSALLDGELLPAQEQGARAHLAVCPDCTRELSAVGQARTWVRALPPVEPPFGFYERMLLDHHPARPAALGARATTFGTTNAAFGAVRPLAHPRPASTLRRRAGAAAFGAAAVAVTVLNVGSPSQRPANPASPRLVEAHATSAPVGADLLSKLTPVGVPVAYRK